MIPENGTEAGATVRRAGGRAAALLAALLLAGCSTVRGDESEVVIEHLAEYPGAAQLLADEHCAKYGKVAEHVRMGATKSSFLWLRGKVSVFECRDKPGAPAARKDAP